GAACMPPARTPGRTRGSRPTGGLSRARECSKGCRARPDRVAGVGDAHSLEVVDLARVRKGLSKGDDAPATPLFLELAGCRALVDVPALAHDARGAERYAERGHREWDTLARSG